MEGVRKLLWWLLKLSIVGCCILSYFFIDQIPLKISGADSSITFIIAPLLVALALIFIVRKIIYKTYWKEWFKTFSAIEKYKVEVKRSLSCCIYMADGNKKLVAYVERILEVIDTKLYSLVKTQLGKKTRVSQTIKSKELFTSSEKKLNSKRIILVGKAGMGKTYFSEEFLRNWVEGRTHRYKCIIYLTFRELNSIEYEISIKELLEAKCESLSSVLTLKNPDDLLIILDGLDEFKYNLNCDLQSSRSDVDSSFPVHDLVSKLITKNLLPNVDVMVTAPWTFLNKLDQYFTCMVVIQGFDDQQMKQYFDYLCKHKLQSESICGSIKKNNISHLASVPLYSFMLHQIMKNGSTLSQSSVKNINTCSRLLIQFLKSCLGYSLKEGKSIFEKLTTVMMAKPAIKQNPEDFIRRLGKLSYNSLLSGQLTVNAEALKKYGLSEKILNKYFSSFFYKKHSNGSSFEYCHATIKEMFAAFYCARVVRDDELKECLDAWVRGIIPPSIKSNLLFHVTTHHRFQLKHFTRLFMGFLSAADSSRLFSDAGRSSSLQSDTATLKDTTRDVLVRWFQRWLQNDLRAEDCLNLLHYIFELQDPDLTKRVSKYIKWINMCTKPLSAIDVQALRFSLKESKLEELDLRFCELGDKGVEQLRDILVNCKIVQLWSNKLSEKSGEILSEILQTPECAIEVLSIGNNNLGPVGVQYLWKALESNQTLRTLCVCGNDIQSKGTETLVQSLEENSTLEEIFLGINDLSEDGLKNVMELRKRRSDLRVM
ncbi:NACHT, LRR and PYD domains-containing protein 12-like [Latimeria chalumnae]|nr:PREDICTED: NACHT, LRR and PYD domains-containing protein 12-like isoform X2 [Latimeria chalumnae]XP_014348502.1 PREDICTED: NACHT, LRR and PYD domains-containing protein 12-like isoform X2 [Latimeria chalumnae]XP_014348503.1 PREDICTED: NACHT, LRR and PYD domains-containing protein 12-like isoform X2 [Latimeria chalumnae]XP_014348504.1 PREDICTED: NACHT, LRR and PYD domains-containing protein 12-like isoform X2 [Latimeria chalumnae]|eukprot:XP_014348501.1 PREDICTED: NACHT, LRR and PYD domains-containing protein 12-like isoform X2 [Latimeria chalumnae]